MSSNDPSSSSSAPSGSASTSTSNTLASSSSGVKVFLPPSSSSPTLVPPPSEDDLKPTPDDLRSAFRSTLAQRHGPDAPLLTRALREKQEAQLGLHTSRNRVFSSVRIRIRFSDRTMIESTFNEADTIDKVYAFLDESLDERVKAKAKVIYTAPPRKEYKRGEGKSLRQLGLIPSAVVNVRWEEPAMNANSFPAPLRTELSERAQELPVPQQHQAQQGQHAHGQQQGQSSTTSTAPSATASAKPMPKWLKNIVKK